MSTPTERDTATARAILAEAGEGCATPGLLVAKIDNALAQARAKGVVEGAAKMRSAAINAAAPMCGARMCGHEKCAGKREVVVAILNAKIDGSSDA